MLVELHQKERDRLEKAARQLEEAMEENARNAQERESAYVAQIEDLNSQVWCGKCVVHDGKFYSILPQVSHVMGFSSSC